MGLGSEENYSYALMKNYMVSNFVHFFFVGVGIVKSSSDVRLFL